MNNGSGVSGMVLYVDPARWKPSIAIQGSPPSQFNAVPSRLGQISPAAAGTITLSAKDIAEL
jgi:hypothetical protein